MMRTVLLVAGPILEIRDLKLHRLGIKRAELHVGKHVHAVPVAVADELLHIREVLLLLIPAHALVEAGMAPVEAHLLHRGGGVLVPPVEPVAEPKRIAVDVPGRAASDAPVHRIRLMGTEGPAHVDGIQRPRLVHPPDRLDRTVCRYRSDARNVLKAHIPNWMFVIHCLEVDGQTARIARKRLLPQLLAPTGPTLDARTESIRRDRKVLENDAVDRPGSITEARRRRNAVFWHNFLRTRIEKHVAGLRIRYPDILKDDVLEALFVDCLEVDEVVRPVLMGFTNHRRRIAQVQVNKALTSHAIALAARITLEADPEVVRVIAPHRAVRHNQIFTPPLGRDGVVLRTDKRVAHRNVA